MMGDVRGRLTRRLVLGTLSALVFAASSAFALAVSAYAATPPAAVHSTAIILLRGHAQTLHLYGNRGGSPVIVSSGDAGWFHLGPHVADVLAEHGYFVVGLDVKAYLESFTTGTSTLRQEDEPDDFKVLADFAAQGAKAKPILIGVSEGAGLSVLAAADAHVKPVIAGVIGLGLPDLNELGWRWKDAVIWITHGLPREPTFSTAAIVERVSPVPLAAIHATQDEYVPLAEVQKLIAAAKEPKRLWIVQASDHRFSDNLAEFDKRLLEAIAWIRTATP
jgi:fermentation-respiration switch protein FrsA (DUF1100 family)